ncbi:SUF system NifU family Fe-S cluster assembly protein [Candidatus Woesearchaeota archaeon]|nr:SUF system NifU family Fe-S cluster assembly protein [Candidatus Woesearchaeota archaeon]
MTARNETDDEPALTAEQAAQIDRAVVGEGPLTEEEEIYKENILDHYRHPHNTGRMSNATFSNRELNPLCGDTIELFVKLDDRQRVCDVKFIGKGCAISQASISLLSDSIKGKTIEEMKNIKREDVLSLLGIPIGVVRMKCALLSLRTLQKGIDTYEASRQSHNGQRRSGECL